MTDRKARDQMAIAIRSYMGESITAFQFDDVLTEAMNTTEDKTVQAIRQALWFHYDDVKDHKIVASKEEWDYFNRLPLLLQSDGEIEVIKSSWHWHFHQAVAALCLIGFAGVVMRTGFGEHLFIFAMPFGIVSMILAWFASRERRKTASAVEAAITPFPSVGSLLSVRRRIMNFTKIKYPKAIAGRRVRDPFINGIMWFPWTMMWLMFSPAVLFFQMLPDRKTETRIKMPEPEGASGMLPARA